MGDELRTSIDHYDKFYMNSLLNHRLYLSTDVHTYTRLLWLSPLLLYMAHTSSLILPVHLNTSSLCGKNNF